MTAQPLEMEDEEIVRFICERAITDPDSNLPRLIAIHESGIRSATQQIEEAFAMLTSAWRALGIRELALELLTAAQKEREHGR